MKELQVFHNDEFGQIRTIFLDGEPWMVGKDIASVLGYKNAKAVDGPFEPVYMGDGTALVCNDSGKVIGMEGNRRLGDTIIAGPFFIVGVDGDDFRSLTDSEIDKYMEQFAEPEQISQQEVQQDMGFTFYTL